MESPVDYTTRDPRPETRLITLPDVALVRLSGCPVIIRAAPYGLVRDLAMHEEDGASVEAAEALARIVAECCRHATDNQPLDPDQLAMGQINRIAKIAITGKPDADAEPPPPPTGIRTPPKVEPRPVDKSVVQNFPDPPIARGLHNVPPPPTARMAPIDRLSRPDFTESPNAPDTANRSESPT